MFVFSCRATNCSTSTRLRACSVGSPAADDPEAGSKARAQVAGGGGWEWGVGLGLLHTALLTKKPIGAEGVSQRPSN